MTTSPPAPALATLRKDVIFREVQGEAVLIDLDSGNLYGLDAVALRAWQALTEYSDLDEATRQLLEVFEGTDLDDLRADLVAFLAELRRSGLLSEPAANEQADSRPSP